MFANYGDKNFFEYGVLVNMENNGIEFSILYCHPFSNEENLYHFADCLVCIEDNWIDRDSVISYLGMTEEIFDAVQFAIGCVDYYGSENFSDGYSSHMFTREEIENRLEFIECSDVIL